MIKNICVFGAASDEIDKSFIEAGEKLGRLMAERNINLVFGGGCTGMMGAVVRGVDAAGGYSKGVAPSFFEKEVLYDNCSEFIYTETMRQRKQIMDSSADAFITTPGGIGTFEEFFEMITLKGLGQTEKPIGILNTNGYYDLLVHLLQHSIKLGFTDEAIMDRLIIRDTPEDLIEAILG